MPARPGPIVAASLLGLACAACSFEAFTYTSGRYGPAKPVLVRLECRDSYEVYDRPDLSSLLVVTSAVTELFVCGQAALPLRERQRRVAEIFLSETSKRPLCRLAGETELTERHREFAYRCPPPG